MRQTTALLDALKRTLRAHGKTYADVASHLELSEASVKRLFAEQSFSVQRLEQVCELIGMEITDLAKMISAEGLAVTEMTPQQEDELAKDVKLLLMANLVINHWPFEDIIATYAIDEHEAITLLAKLDRLKLIQLLPGNKVKLLVSRQFHWRENGPVQRFFDKHVQREFFNSRFNKNGEQLTFVSGMLSRASHAHFLRSIGRLASEFDELSRLDATLPLSDRFGCTLVVAIRPWELAAFTKLRREGRTKVF